MVSVALRVGNGHAKLVSFLIGQGTDPTAQVKGGQTHLQFSWRPKTNLLWKAMEGTQFLVERGADLTVHDKDGMARLHSVSGNGHVQVVQSN